MCYSCTAVRCYRHGASVASARRGIRPPGSVARCSLLNAVLWALTAANVATFVVALSRNSWQIEALGSNPTVGPSASALRETGARDSAAIVGASRELWRLASSLFLCSGAWPVCAGLTAYHSLVDAVLCCGAQTHVTFISLPIILPCCGC